MNFDDEVERCAADDVYLTAEEVVSSAFELEIIPAHLHESSLVGCVPQTTKVGSLHGFSELDSSNALEFTKGDAAYKIPKQES